nr:hypothetical protein [Ochrobactrum sp. UNC390CL2Tsu3S39]
MIEAIIFGSAMLGFFAGWWVAYIIGVWNMHSGSYTRDPEPWAKK